MTFDQAAAVPVSGGTALHSLRDRGELEAGQRALIIGAAGGVGTFAVQLAKAFGAHVTGVCSGRKAELSGRSAPTRRSITPARTSPTAVASST